MIRCEKNTGAIMKFLSTLFILLFSLNSHAIEIEKITPVIYNELINNIKTTDNGNIENNLGILFEFGNKYFDKDINKAVAWYKISAKKGYNAAKHNLSLIYCANLVPDPEYKNGNYWLKEAIKSKDEDTLIIYAAIIGNGKCGFKEDAEKAHKIFLELALKGNLKGAFNVAAYYSEKQGNGKYEMNRQSYIWGTHLVKRGYPLGLYNLLKLHYYGDYVKQDLQKAYMYSVMAIKSGFFGPKYIKSFIIDEQKKDLTEKQIKEAEKQADILMKKWKIKIYDKPEFD